MELETTPGRSNSASILECMAKIAAIPGEPVQYEYKEKPRVGDHPCYISDMRKFKKHYPQWSIQRSLDSILEDMVEACACFIDGHQKKT